MIARPALPAALAALLDCRPGEETPAQWLAMPGCALALGDIGGAGRQRDGARFVVPRSPNARFLDPIGMGRNVRRSWITRDPAEAWEILDARGLLPPEGMRGFWRSRLGVGTWSDRPATIPDLVAWASLGADAIVTAEALTVEACRDLRGWGVATCERVVWRAGARSLGASLTYLPAVSKDLRRLHVGVQGGATKYEFSARGETRTATRDIAPVRALWDAGLALERVGAECVVCVPPIGGAT